MPGSQGEYRIGVVGVADGWSTQRLVETVAAQAGFSCLVELDHVVLDLAAQRVLCRGLDLGTLDALIVKKLGHRYAPELLDRLEVLHFLHARGTPIFSKPASIMRLLDRLACTVMLRIADIPMPDTVITEDVERAAEAVERFGEAVLKPLFSTKARGMTVIDARGDVRAKVEQFRSANNPVLYVQKKIDLPGRDLGLAFLGGEYLASYARVGKHGSWNTTTRSGGKYQPAEPSEAIIDLARRAQAPFDLDFTCVDVAESTDGPVVFEVSAFGGFRGLQEACNIDAARLYTDYVLGKLRDGE